MDFVRYRGQTKDGIEFSSPLFGFLIISYRLWDGNLILNLSLECNMTGDPDSDSRTWFYYGRDAVLTFFESSISLKSVASQH